MTVLIVNVTIEVHCCTATSCDYGGKTNEIIIIATLVLKTKYHPELPMGDRQQAYAYVVKVYETDQVVNLKHR